MSISVLQTPAAYAFAGNPMWVNVSGTNNISGSYQYGFTVSTDEDLDGVYVQRILDKKPARPDGYGLYDPRLVLKDYVPNASGDISLTETSFNRDPAWIKYRIKCAEYVSGTALASATTVLTSGFCMLGGVKTMDFPAFSISDYLLSSSSKKFLTASPRTRNIFSNQHEWLYFIQTSYWAYKLEVNTYTSDGSLYNTIRINNSYINVSGTDLDRFQRVAVGTYQMNQIPISGVTVVTGPTPTNIILPQITKYTVQTLSILNIASSELFTFNIIDSSCKYETIRVHFMNRFGKFDSFNFPLVSRKNRATEKATYNKPLGVMTAGVFGYTKKDRSKTQFWSKAQTSLSVTSDWMTTSESCWMEDLLDSPFVFIQTDSSTLIAVNVTDTAMEVKETENDDLINYTFTLEYATVDERY